MTAAWVVVAVASFLLAALLAVVDGALVTAGHAATKRALEDPERAHRGLALARILAHLVMGTSVTLGVLAFGLTGSGAALVAGGLLFVHVVLVEGLALSTGQARAATLIGRVAASAFVIDLLMRPITVIGAFLESGLSRLLPPTDNTSVPALTGTEQFRELVEAEADVSPAEAAVLHGVFSLADTQVREIMVPRVDIVGIDASTSWSEMLDRVRSSEHARFPVFEGELDNVLGILYAKDLLPAVVSDESPEEWKRLIRPVTFIPITKTIDQQLRDFKAQRTHIALVLDEYGGIQGVVTIEDVLEEIVGEIHDEFDEVDPTVVQEEGQRYWVSGSLSLADLSELVGSDFQREDLTTVGGLVYEAFGRVPRAGESRQIDGFRVVVERVRRRRVERVYFERVQPEHAA